MGNLFWKAYEPVDKVLLYSAEETVKAWNWVTGRSKTDLANLILATTTITAGVGFYLDDPVSGMVLAPVLLLSDELYKMINRAQERRELKASDNDVLLNAHDNHKRKVQSVIDFGLAGYFGSSPFGTSIGYHIVSGSCVARGFSEYVMRVNDLPRRNHVLSRAKDRLVGMIEAYKPKPVIAPGKA